MRRRWVGISALVVALRLLAASVPAQAQGREETDQSSSAPSAAERPTAPETKLPAGMEDLRTPFVVQAGPIDPDRYVLGPGDVLELDLWGKVSKTTLLNVSPDGTVLLPDAGPIQVSGRTLTWARQHIQQQVAQLLRGVHAEVRLVQLRKFKVYVLGMVHAPGAVVATSATRASEVVTGVGLLDGGSRRNIELRHVDGTRARLDLELFEATGRLDLNPTVVDGDVIMVPRSTTTVGVVGAVARPKMYEFAAGDSLSTLIDLGGGLLPAAAPDPALLIRFPTASQRESLWVDLAAMVARTENPALRDGDELFIQFRADYHEVPVVGIYGEVERPGAYPIVAGRDRLSDVIRWAGGFRPLAYRAAIHLLRETEKGNEKDPEFDRLVRLSRSEMTASEYVKFQTKLAERKNSFRVDWSRIQKETVDIDPLLHEGDVVRVDPLVPTVRVEGEVRRPGLVDYAPGRTLREYVELSGGFTERAARRDIRVSRSLTGQVIPGRSLASVQAGDFVWVPERKDVDAWGVFRDVVGVVGQVALVIFTLSR